jgi:3',5'-cyclic AMP phosphodiesterase CpdA
MKLLLIGLLFSSLIHAETKVIVISDLNGSYGSKSYEATVFQAVSKIAEIKPDMVLVTGDMVAGQKKGLDYFGMWEAFHKAVTIPLTKLDIPLAVTPGNHDGSGELNFKLERDIYVGQWTKYKPKVEYLNQDFFPHYYSFKKHNILFISLDATLVGPLDQKQKKWLVSQLQEHKHFRHTVVFGHIPVFAVVEKKASEILADTELQEIFRRYGVDLYLSGHHHAYYPGYYDGVRHISQACLGGGPRKLIGDESVSKKSFTEILFKDDGTISVEAYAAPHFIQKVDRQTLPRSIKHKSFELVRDDLVL